MFFNFTIDMFLLLGAGLNLLLWFRFSEGDRLSSLFRNVFFTCLALFIGSLLYRYSGVTSDHTEWLITAGQVMLLGFASMFIGLFKRIKVPLVLSAVLILAGLFGGKSLIDKIAFDQTNFPEVSKNWEFIVKTQHGQSPADAKAVKAHDMSVDRAFVDDVTPIHELDDYYVINIPAKCEPRLMAIKSQLEADTTFEVVEWNEVLRAEPRFEELQKKEKHKSWADDPDISNQWYFDLLQMDDVHRYLNFTNIKPKKTAKLFILDSGVDAKHEDIQANYSSYKGAYDKDGNGHGTHCAGIATAVTNNGKGIASMIPDKSYVTVTGVKVMTAFGIGTQRTIIRGILEAVDAGADVISMSLGGVSSDAKQSAYAEAFQYAYDNDVIVVVAAGNSDDEASRYTPANVDGVICVSAIDQTGKKSFFSNFMDDIDMPLAAPGSDIYSTMPNNKYATLSGTSMSTPFVSSIVALMKSINPDLSAHQIYEILNETGLDTESEKSTGKLIQPYEAIKMLKSEPIAKSSKFPALRVNQSN